MYFIHLQFVGGMRHHDRTKTSGLNQLKRRLLADGVIR